MATKNKTNAVALGAADMANYLVKLNNGQTTTSSRTMATHFKKLHKNIIRDIENLECSNEFKEANFFRSEYVSSRNRAEPEYQITRDGFTFLAMGFSGKEAAVFKEQYIAAFNYMEKGLQLYQAQLSFNADMAEIRQLMHTIKGQNDLDAPNIRWQPATWHRLHIQNLVERNRQSFGQYANVAMRHSLLTNPVAVSKAAGWTYTKITNFLYGTGRMSLDDLLTFCEVCGLDLLFMNKFGEIIWPDNYPAPAAAASTTKTK